MASSGSVFSQTLQDITNTKLAELSKKREVFEKNKATTLKSVESQDDPTEKLTILANGVKKCFSIATDKSGRVIDGGSQNFRLGIDLKNLERFLGQARFDPNISPKVVAEWKDSIINHLEVQSLKYTYADLYGQLTMEWLNSSKSNSVPQDDDLTMSDDFEELSTKNKLEARQNWEKQAFEASGIDSKSIVSFLQALFKKSTQKALEKLQDAVADFERQMCSPGAINPQSLKWVIKGLLASDLLTEEKRQVLRDFLNNKIILSEVADVLDMRLTALETWSWGSEVPLEQRRQVNGAYHIYMHEDLLQAIFLQFIGVKWSVFLKKQLIGFIAQPDVWKPSGKKVPVADKKRRYYYLLQNTEHPNVNLLRHYIFKKNYFVSQLLDEEDQDRSLEEGDMEADLTDVVRMDMSYGQQADMRQAPRALASQVPMMAMQQAPSMPMGAGTHRNRLQPEREYRNRVSYLSNSSSGRSYYDDLYQPKNPMDAKQQILHLLSTDILIKTNLESEITCFRSQLDHFNPSLPHESILTVMKFFGVSEKWLNFFSTFLEAPLRFLEDGNEADTRKRKRGTPGAHVLSDVFGEVILFCLDYSINQRADGEPLWRMHDDFWFWSPSHKACVGAWKTVHEFCKIMGLKTNPSKTGCVRIQRIKDESSSGSASEADEDISLASAALDPVLPRGDIRWGMLQLNPTTGRFEIDRRLVNKHIDELSGQLKDKEKSIFAWIQAYSTYASVFFTSNFGRPANCFGREHVDNMLQAHKHIQQTLFKRSSNSAGDTGSVIDYLKLQISERFGIPVSSIPDGYFFFPTELGGLEVKSPFIGLLQIRDSVAKSPPALIKEFLTAEREAYDRLKKEFEEHVRAGTLSSRRSYDYYNEKYVPKGDDATTFFSFEEYIRHRELLSYNFDNELHQVYKKLLERPREVSIDSDDDGIVKTSLNAMQSKYNRITAADEGQSKGKIMPGWYTMEPYWQWVAQLYGPEMIERFGGFFIVDPGLLPIGMVGLFKSGRVNWQD